MSTNAYLMLLVFVVANIAAASSGAFFKPGDWYERINKPSWRPRNWMFPVVWTVLYGLIAYAGWLYWLRAEWPAAAGPLALYFVSLLINASWSGVFFGMRRPDLAMISVGLLWLSILGMIIAFHPASPGAAYLLVPYLLWVSTAAVLNYQIWRMNRPLPA
ncbi:MAG: TspO/MBR family protein [Geminicoccaceae bacterium]